jgi:hypothetical protein
VPPSNEASPHRGGEAALTTRSSRLRAEHARRTSAHPLTHLANIDIPEQPKRKKK